MKEAREKAAVPENACHVSLDEALDELKPDLVVCVTPPAVHKEVVIAALEAGAHVITEKPLSDSLDAAQQMVEKAEAVGKRFAVSQNYRYSPQAIAVRNIMREKRCGEMKSMSVEFYRGPLFEGSFRRHMAYPLVADMGIHHYDLMRAIVMKDAKWTFARCYNPSWSWYDGAANVDQVIQFDGDIWATYAASWCSLGAETPWNGNWRIECSEGCVIWRGDKVFVGKRPNDLEEVHPPEEGDFGQEAVLAEFLKALEEDRDPETCGRDNLNSMALVFGTIEAAETGAVVQL